MSWEPIFQIIATFIITIIVPPLLSIKKKQLQFRFYPIKKGGVYTHLVIRNISADSIFIDQIKIHKTYFEEIDITKYFFERTVLLKTGEMIETVLSEKEIESFFDDICKMCKIDNDIKRIGVKLVAYTSSGQLTTTWFKIGFNKHFNYSSFYDFIYYYKDYYNIRCRFFSNMVRIRLLLFPTICLSVVLFILGYHSMDCKIIITSIAYLAILMIVVMISMDGFKKIWGVLLSSIIATIPAIVIISDYFASDKIIFIIASLFFIWGCTFVLLRRLSGWDM